jgi:hypothetical protein
LKLHSSVLICTLLFGVACQSSQPKPAAQKQTPPPSAEVNKDSESKTTENKNSLDQGSQTSGDPEQDSASELSDMEKAGSLPLPSPNNHFATRKFLEKYRRLYTMYEPLYPEFDAIERVLASPTGPTKDETIAMQERLQENPEKAHWVFCVGLMELYNSLQTSPAKVLRHDREKMFLRKIKTLVYLADKNDSFFGGKRYKQFVRSLYVELSKQHFGRELK